MHLPSLGLQSSLGRPRVMASRLCPFAPFDSSLLSPTSPMIGSRLCRVCKTLLFSGQEATLWCCGRALVFVVVIGWPTSSSEACSAARFLNLTGGNRRHRAGGCGGADRRAGRQAGRQAATARAKATGKARHGSNSSRASDHQRRTARSHTRTHAHPDTHTPTHTHTHAHHHQPFIPL